MGTNQIWVLKDGDIIPIAVMISREQICAQTYEIIHFQHLQFTVSRLDLNLPVKKLSEPHEEQGQMAPLALV